MQAPLNETAYLAFSEQKRKKVNKKNSWYEHEASCFLLCIHDCAKKLALKKERI